MSLSKRLAIGLRASDRARAIPYAILLVAGIALIDWRVVPNISLGFLYVFPILVAAPWLNRWQILTGAAGCTLLRETFSPFAWQPGFSLRLLTVSAGFATVGLFVSELHRSRTLAVLHLQQKEREIQLREQAELELKAIIETTPLAVVTLDEEGRMLLVNEGAVRLLGAAATELVGTPVSRYIPAFGGAPRPAAGGLQLRVDFQSTAQRHDGEPFLAHVWASSYGTGASRRTAVVVWDGSDDLRDREHSSFDAILATSRGLLGAMSHEIRNFAAVAATSYADVRQIPGAAADPAVERLGKVLAGLESIAGASLRLASQRPSLAASPRAVLDEARVVIEPVLREAGIEVAWEVDPDLPMVRCDSHGLAQVMLNLSRNAGRALAGAARKQLRIRAYREGERVLVSFEDSGPKVQTPERLFLPFADSGGSGLGLFVSRAIVRSFGGDLRYQPGPAGACFIVELREAA